MTTISDIEFARIEVLPIYIKNLSKDNILNYKNELEHAVKDILIKLHDMSRSKVYSDVHTYKIGNIYEISNTVILNHIDQNIDNSCITVKI